jgi:hypothetical protein
VIFLGDFIDRGESLYEHKELLGIVMKMVRAGNALSVMGNHEFNALAYHTEVDGMPLRPHSKKNTDQHQAFLQEFGNDPIAKAEVLEFFKTLPLWIELDELRVVHACWDQSSIDTLTRLCGGPRMTTELLIKASDPNTEEHKCVEIILKGYGTPLPNGISFLDKDGNKRHAMRTQWWKTSATCLGEVAIPPDIELGPANDLPVPTDIPRYDRNERPCFIGHYWLRGKPSRLSSNVACLDYSVAKQGKLVAYRWNTETRLADSHFEYVRAQG